MFYGKHNLYMELDRTEIHSLEFEADKEPLIAFVISIVEKYVENEELFTIKLIDLVIPKISPRVNSKKIIRISDRNRRGQ